MKGGERSGDPAEAPRSDRAARAPRAHAIVATALCLALGTVWVARMSTERTWGWDEVMHTAVPAIEILLPLERGDWPRFWRAIHECERYPFLYPLYLASVQLVTGVSEEAGRYAGRAILPFGLIAVFLLAREAIATSRDHRAARLAPWLALAFAATSPMAHAFAGSYFMEVAYFTLMAWTVRAWLRRGRGPAPWRRDLGVGLWLTAAFFLKYTYGGLLAGALGLDWLAQAVGEGRAGRLRAFVLRSLWIGAPLALGLLWWFVVPLPFGGAMAASHREAFLSYLGANQEPAKYVPQGLRFVHWSCFLSATPRMLLLAVLGLLATAPVLLRPGARALWLVFFAGGFPVWTHNFHIERFLLPGSMGLWVLAGWGVARTVALLPGAALRVAAAASLLAIALLPTTLDGELVLRACVGEARNEEEASARRAVLDRFYDLSPDRPIETSGLRAEEGERLLDLVAAEVGPEESLGWLGLSNEVSPGMIHIGLWQRGGSERRLVAEVDRPRPDGEPAMDVVMHSDVDPEWSDAKLLAWARQFDVVVSTDPVNPRNRPARRFLSSYRDRLAAMPETEAELLGEVPIRWPDGSTVRYRVWAFRAR